MNHVECFAERQQQVQHGRIYTLVALAVWSLVLLVLIAISVYHIHAYSQKPAVATGTLEKVMPSINGSIELSVSDTIYKIYKDNRYSKRSFGVIDNLPKNNLMKVLDAKNGQDVYLEWVQVGSVKQIIQLSIDRVEFVDKDSSISDFIGNERSNINICLVLLAITAIVFLLVWKKIAH